MTFRKNLNNIAKVYINCTLLNLTLKLTQLSNETSVRLHLFIPESVEKKNDQTLINCFLALFF